MLEMTLENVLVVDLVMVLVDTAVVFVGMVFIPAVVVSMFVVTTVVIGLLVMMDEPLGGFEELLLVLVSPSVSFEGLVMLLLLVGLFRLDILWGRGGNSRLSVSRSLCSSSVMLVAQVGDGCDAVNLGSCLNVFFALDMVLLTVRDTIVYSIILIFAFKMINVISNWG